jgi:oligopeptide transport system permease protein
MFEKKADKAAMAVAKNEFNQYVKPTSLWADAWKRLRKNKMALVSLFIIGFYMIVCLSAQLLTKAGIIYSHSMQVIEHQELPPSFMPAGELTIRLLEEKKEKFQSKIDEFLTTEGEGENAGEEEFKFGADATADGQATPEAAEQAKPEVARLQRDIRILDESIAKLKVEISTNPVHKRIYLLGTDGLGRDMLARIIYGGQISILVGLIATFTAVLIGTAYGAIAGYVGGWVDNVMMRIVDVLYGLPYIIMVILIMVFVPARSSGEKMLIIFISIAALSWLTLSRVVRGQIISLKNSEFVEAARSIGAPSHRIIFRHLLPNTLGVIIVFSTLMIPSFILSESFLSYLGMGISAPDASWGTLVSEGVNSMSIRPWMLLDPAIAMTIFLFCMNFLGDGLRDALDPQSKNRG